MALHRPLVLVSGRPSVLPAGDSLEGVSAGGLNTGTATLNFGAGAGSQEATVTVSGLPTITANSAVFISVSALDSTVDHTPNDHKYLPLFCRFSYEIQAGSSLKIIALAEQPLTGAFMVRYVWS